MFFGPSPAQWVAVAEAFELRPFEPTAGFSRGTGFRQLKRTLGVPVSTGVSFKHWLYGTYRGTEVAIVTFEEGSGSSTTSYTGAIARIDPPSFLGLGITKHGWIRFFESEDVRVGHPPLDEVLRIEGASAERVSKFFELGDPTTLPILQRAAGLASLGEFWITDSTAAVAATGNVVDVAALRRWLDQTTELAKQMSARVARFPRTPGELAHQGEWQRFADAHGFAFDPLRMKMTSSARHLEIALETEGRAMKTAVTLLFPQHIGLGFSVRRTQTPSFLQGLFSQDIVVGSPAFDSRYIVTGFPEASIRALLARPNVLAALTYLGERSMEVQMNHAQLFFRLDGASPTGAHLATLVALAKQVSADLFGEVGAGRPFR